MFGVFLTIIAAILIGIGVFLQKISLGKISVWKDIFKSYKWVLGYLICIFSFFLYLLALKYERLSIVQPLVNFSIIILIMLEAIFLKEKIKGREIFVLILFFTGILLIGM